jgi:hypothetical protein
LDLNVAYMRCCKCGYVQTEYPHWLERAYASSINDADTGILSRNQNNVFIVVATLAMMGALDARVVDFAGGYGILTRLLRDIGVEALWSDAYSENLLARGFEHKGESAGLVTAFESFEHFVEPGIELDRMLAISPNILLSTEIIPEPVPDPDQWWYYGREHGQHIGFFTLETLQMLARGRNAYLASDGRSCHLITKRRVNPALWRCCLKLRKPLTLLVRPRLKSRIWADHLERAAHPGTDQPG